MATVSLEIKIAVATNASCLRKLLFMHKMYRLRCLCLEK